MSEFWKCFCLVLVTALVVFGYCEWSPLVYGRKMGDREQESRMWNKAWLYGRKGRAEWLARYEANFNKYEEQRLKSEARLKRANRTY
jgi:hypothetical protein